MRWLLTFMAMVGYSLGNRFPSDLGRAYCEVVVAFLILAAIWQVTKPTSKELDL